ncbi:MAG: AraC family transcriptional regulator [Cyclobacteriaceae bacterium]|jgi:AraC-like DNA-binding protein|nr:AraC family transcriptional regulator [Cyclobacteriaceae bacterium]
MIAVENQTTHSPNQTLSVNILSTFNDCQINLQADELAIFLILDGGVDMLSRGKVEVLESGCGFLVNHIGFPKILHCYENFQALFIKMPVEFVQKVFANINYKPGTEQNLVSLNRIMLKPTIELEIFMRSMEMYTQHYPNDFTTSLHSTKIVEFFWLVSQDLKKEILDRFLQPYYVPHRLIFDEVLEKNFQENVSISELAQQVGCSVSTFKRRFEDIYKCTPGSWLLNRRLEEAKILLEATNKSIAEIGYEVGFQNPSHFIQTFKAKFGCTPKRLQRNKLAA